uniref:non-specific serine/threonine protein kinase n=1 Tax=Oryza rufipogon TaxID=4529 RepID=A0A0E0P6X9_ORYRU
MRSSRGFIRHSVWCLVFVWSWRVAAAQDQQAPKTDPVEAVALNTILRRWGKQASSEWNVSGDLCSGFAADKNDWDHYPNINPFIKCDCTFSNNTLCHITKLRVNKLDVVGQIPSELQNLTRLENLALGFNPLSGPLPKELGNLTNLISLGISLNNFTGGLPEELGNLTKLKQFLASDNGFTGKIPDYLGSMTNLEEMRIGDIVNGISPLALISNLTSLNTLILRNCKIYGDLGAVDFSMFEKLSLLFLGNNNLAGRLPDGISSSLKAMNLVANNFLLGSTSNSNTSTRGSDNTIYEADPANLGAATYYVTGQTRWGVSSVGHYFRATDAKNIIYSSQNFNNVVDSKLFETGRVSPSSLRYYGLGLENGNYTVLLRFAEIAFPDSQTWLSLGRRVFDIYIQGALKEKDFDIRKTAGGKSFSVVNRSFMVTVSKNFLEIHLFWADFTPTVRNGIPKSESKVGIIAGISIGAIVLVLAALFGVFTLLKKRRALAYQKEELYYLVGQPDVFNYAELKLATDNFSSQNILGEGGFGPVYKQYFVHAQNIHVTNLAGKTPLLVYEYLENGSLDQAIFGIASGLTYLHEESSVRIVHRDIKASNVLLDTDLTPKISDFGLAKLYDEKQTHVSTRIAGTLGYLAPEYAMRGHLSEKADVFAFGVVMLETVAGRPNTNNSLEENKIYLLEWAWGMYDKDQALEIVDPTIKDFDKDEAFRVINVALLCTQGSPHQRPPMSRVVAMLTRDVDAPKVVTKPSYINEWQLRGGGNNGNTSNSYAGSSYQP